MNRRNESMLFGFSEDEKLEVIEPTWRIPQWFSALGEEKLNKLKIYQEELFRFNEKLNLISPNTKVNADSVHFADSILAAEKIIAATQFSKIHDIGSGNGFPGLVMAILYPEKHFVLIDKDERKIEFLKIMTGRLSLSNVEAKCMKVEDIPEASIECAVSRAFAPLGNAVVVTRKPFKQGGEYYHLKGDSWATEVMDIPVQACSFWSNDLVGEYKLPDGSKSGFVVLTKRE